MRPRPSPYTSKPCARSGFRKRKRPSVDTEEGAEPGRHSQNARLTARRRPLGVLVPPAGRCGDSSRRRQEVRHGARWSRSPGPHFRPSPKAEVAALSRVHPSMPGTGLAATEPVGWAGRREPLTRFLRFPGPRGPARGALPSRPGSGALPDRPLAGHQAPSGQRLLPPFLLGLLGAARPQLLSPSPGLRGPAVLAPTDPRGPAAGHAGPRHPCDTPPCPGIPGPQALHVQRPAWASTARGAEGAPRCT